MARRPADKAKNISRTGWGHRSSPYPRSFPAAGTPQSFLAGTTEGQPRPIVHRKH
jgi:hypothetical protein